MIPPGTVMRLTNIEFSVLMATTNARTLADIAAWSGYRSRSAVLPAIRSLQRKGLIANYQGKQGAIRPTLAVVHDAILWEENPE